jgi:integrase
MIPISRNELKYRSVELSKEVHHFILIAHSKKKHILLSHPNLFLYNATRSSIKTSARYSSIISMFYRFLSTLDKYKGIDISRYHAIADNKDIRLWQIQRQVDRVNKNKHSPTSETIFEDAKILLIYFNWLNSTGYITNVAVKKKSWIVNFKSKKMLSYIQKKAKVSIDSSSIKVLDKEKRQSSNKSLITNNEIKQLIVSFNDPVYAALFKLSLGTAMRPMELCKFPYIGNGVNSHIMPYSELDKTHKTVDFTVVGKGNKTRSLKINVKDLDALEKHYINPYYIERTKLYEKKYGHPCPPSILFLNKKGTPVTPEMIASRANSSKTKAMKNHSEFREKITFYEARHWWPTQFLISFFKDRLLTESADALYAACAEALTKQMGHDDLETTYKHYVDMARLVLHAHQGKTHELITSPDITVEEFIENI